MLDYLMLYVTRKALPELRLEKFGGKIERRQFVEKMEGFASEVWK